MKKLFIAACLLLSAATSSKAQWYVGGDVGYGSRSSKTETTPGQTEKGPSQKAFSLTPRVGYIFSDRWLAGLGMGATWGQSIRYQDDEKQKAHTTTFSVAPYSRFNFLFFGPFGVGIEGAVRYSMTDTKDDTLPDQIKSHGRTRLEVAFTPVMELDVSERVSLECRLNFISVRYMHDRDVTKYTSGGKTVFRSNAFNAAVTGDEIFTTGSLTFGAIIKF